MFAVFRAGGKQYKVAKDDVIRVERLAGEAGDQVVLDRVLMVDDKIGVIQPYLPQARGVDSPTLLIERRDDGVGLFPVFVQVFDALWGRSKAV